MAWAASPERQSEMESARSSLQNTLRQMRRGAPAQKRPVERF